MDLNLCTHTNQTLYVSYTYRTRTYIDQIKNCKSNWLLVNLSLKPFKLSSWNSAWNQFGWKLESTSTKRSLTSANYFFALEIMTKVLSEDQLCDYYKNHPTKKIKVQNLKYENAVSHFYETIM